MVRLGSVSYAALAAKMAFGQTLQSYNADPSSLSVSGLSSGAFMAVQLGVAYSNTFTVGFGVFAGGPFDCARNQNYVMCNDNNTPSITTPDANMNTWSGNQIDPVSNLKNRKIYLEVGLSDYTVGENPMNQLNSQLSNFVTSSNVKYDKLSSQAHTFPTDFSGSGDNACGSTASPYISNCNFDGAGAVLQQMYGTLNAKNTGTLTGSVVQYSQSGNYAAQGMGSTGFLYVPKACQSGSTSCKVHVALHGCVQDYGSVGMDFVQNTGYNMWADTNNMIIVYPQTTTDDTAHQTWDSGSLSNANACWDWVGWYGNNADQHGGVQMEAIIAQVNQITSGYKSGGGTSTTGKQTTTKQMSTTPTTLQTTTTTTSAATTTMTCAYAGEYLYCSTTFTYDYCYYLGETYTC